MRIAATWSCAVLAGVALLAGCGASPDHEGGPTGTPSESPTPGETPYPSPTPIAGTLELVRRLPHAGWSEGLDMHDGELWHAYPGTIKVYDPVSGDLLREYEPPSTYSESLAWRDGEIWNVSYHDSNVYVGTPAANGASIAWRIAGETPDVHGWGITHDETSVIVTGNGKETLWFLDPETLAVTRTIETPVDDLEDIAFDRGAIWASSYSEYHGQFFRIDPADGSILDVHALPDASECEIVDGIAADGGELYVTGKDCPFVYVYALP